jgi:hypothetical protein
MVDMTRFNQYLTLADQLLSVSSKEEIAECARLLAINVAHYQSVYGDLTLDATLNAAYADQPNQAQIDLMTSGMETLVGVLGGLTSDITQSISH